VYSSQPAIKSLRNIARSRLLLLLLLQLIGGGS